MPVTFAPLHWVYHDSWRYNKWGNWNLVYPYYGSPYWEWTPIDGTHHGHMHFFLADRPWTAVTAKSWAGNITFTMNLDESWGPNSGDPNQQFNYRIVGRPVWRILVEEYWRRIYVQPWELQDEPKGIKFDASQHVSPIYREHYGKFATFSQSCRTLPIEYWHPHNMTTEFPVESDAYKHGYRIANFPYGYIRDHHVRYDSKRGNVPSDRKGIFNYLTDYDHNCGTVYAGQPRNRTQLRPNGSVEYWEAYPDMWMIPLPGSTPGAAASPGWGIPQATIPHRGGGWFGIQETNRPQIDSNIRQDTWGDQHYIYPTIEYQITYPMYWERPMGYNENEDSPSAWVNGADGEDFGDGLSVTVILPMRNKEGVIMSPFFDDEYHSIHRQCLPAGAYSDHYKVRNTWGGMGGGINDVKLVNPVTYSGPNDFKLNWDENGYIVKDGEKIPIGVGLGNLRPGNLYRPGSPSTYYGFPSSNRRLLEGDNKVPPGEDDPDFHSGNWGEPGGKPVRHSEDRLSWCPNDLRALIDRRNPLNTDAGIWTEQFLGGIVMAQVDVYYEDLYTRRRGKFGTVTTTTFCISSTFSTG